MESDVHQTPNSGVPSHRPTVLTKENVSSSVLCTSDPLVQGLKLIGKKKNRPMLAGYKSFRKRKAILLTKYTLFVSGNQVLTSKFH